MSCNTLYKDKTVNTLGSGALVIYVKITGTDSAIIAQNIIACTLCTGRLISK